MKKERVTDILDRIRQARVAIYGDFCLDAYWNLDPRGSEVSVETGLQAQAVARQSYSLGGAANVAANLAALAPAEIRLAGVVGDDVFGRELRRQLGELGVATDGLTVQSQDYETVTFGKRILEGEEIERVDFGMANQRSAETDAAILATLRAAAAEVSVVIINQQVPGSIANNAFFAGIEQLVADFPETIFLVDSRHYGECFKNVWRKTNDLEAARLNGVAAQPGDVLSLAAVQDFAGALFARDGSPVFVSRGPRGILLADGDGVHEVPGIQVLKKVDAVGAGDTALSAIAGALAAGSTAAEAAELANFAAAVTVQKLFVTGTARGPEIEEVAADPDYVYQPDLALDVRQATYAPEAEIELCCDPQILAAARIRHAVFDHDGTLSALREGWETVMEAMMLRSILGDRYETADETLYHRVLQRVRDYIDKSTGIQTILQMDALAEMVREFGVVPADQVLDKVGYKQVYDEALLQMVDVRIRKLRSGQLDVNDFAIKGAVTFLHALRERGVTLYLASGTDRDAVCEEATAMGYADLFDGGMHGAVGDVTKYSKQMLINEILTSNGLSGSELVVLGDGPVELRECRKCNGIAVGIASDDIRRHSLNPEKRARLIKAGAHLVVPDFSQGEQLLDLLFQ